MVLGNDFNGEVMFKYIDVRRILHSFYKAVLNLESCVVGMVQDTELAVAAFAVQVETTVGVLVEIHAPAYQFVNLRRSAFHHLFHSLGVAEPVAGNHSVVNVFVKIVYFEIGNGSDAALSESCICLVECCFAHQSDFPAFAGNFKGKAHAGNARAYHKIVVFVCHFLLF